VAAPASGRNGMMGADVSVARVEQENALNRMRCFYVALSIASQSSYGKYSHEKAMFSMKSFQKFLKKGTTRLEIFYGAPHLQPMTDHPKIQNLFAHAAHGSEKAVGSAVSRLALFAVDESAHSNDGLLLHGWDGPEQVTAFISRRVMDDWVDPRRSLKSRKSLFRAQYNDLGKRNLGAIESIATLKYERGPGFNRQHPFVDILLSDITESGAVLDVSSLA